MRGKFVTIEGCDGVGKSTQIELLKKALSSKNVDFVFTREPGGTRISEHIRGIISDPLYSEMDSVAELLLYTAARRQHVVEFLDKQLELGRLVICDRFIDSTLAYQGYGRGINQEAIEICNKIALGNLKIDLTLFFDLSPTEAFLRKGGADRSDRLECENFDFYNRVYNGYLEIAKLDRVMPIDAHGTEMQVHERVLAALRSRGIL